MNYYTYDETSKSLIPAPKVILMEDGSRVTGPILTEQYAAVGAYPLGTPAPIEVTEGKVVVPDGYVLDKQAGCWRRKHRLEDAPPPPSPVYDKYKLTLALEKAKLLEDFMSFIAADPVLYFKWNAATQLDYEDDMLSNALAAIKEALDVTDEQVAAILAEAEV